MTRLRIETLTIPGAPLGAENPLPVFRSPNPDPAPRLLPSVSEEKRRLIGWQTGFRCLPYRMQDDYSRQRRPLAFHAIVLENDTLSATFLPELGGRLISLIHHPTGRELLSRNPVFQPANLAIRNAWFSGGIEWNIGQVGHTFSTCSPIFAAAIQGSQGEPALRLYEYERCKGLFWQIDFYLPEGSDHLTAYTRVVNPARQDASMYWWTNTAVPEAPDVRVLAPSGTVLYVDFLPDGAVHGLAEMPYLPTTGGKDASYSTYFNFASEYFFQLDGIDLPWEAALGGDGRGFFEASSAFLRYRKMFCWGQHAGGQHWQDFLSLPGQRYLEIQAGLAPTQLHGLVMPGGATWDWVQVFGLFEGDPAQIHQADFKCASAYVDGQLRRRLGSAEGIERLRTACRARADQRPERLLHSGAGWGALELARRVSDPGALPVPVGLCFPPGSLGSDQQPWLDLLTEGHFAAPDPADHPGAWMTQPEWRERLEALPEQNWVTLLHLGVMRLEAFDEGGAESAWIDSLRMQPSVWAYRNLAVLAKRQGREAESLNYYMMALDLAQTSGVTVAALAVECLEALIALRRFAGAQAFYQSLPVETRDHDRVQILYGRAALELGNYAAVEEILRRDFAVIREGEIELTDLWMEMWTRREGLVGEDLLYRHPVPPAIDFRMESESPGDGRVARPDLILW